MNVNIDKVSDGGEGHYHDYSPGKQDRSTTPFVHDVPWRNGRGEVGQAVDSRHEDSVAAHPSGRLKDKRRIV